MFFSFGIASLSELRLFRYYILVIFTPSVILYLCQNCVLFGITSLSYSRSLRYYIFVRFSYPTVLHLCGNHVLFGITSLSAVLNFDGELRDFDDECWDFDENVISNHAFPLESEARVLVEWHQLVCHSWSTKSCPTRVPTPASVLWQQKVLNNDRTSSEIYEAWSYYSSSSLS